MDYLVRQEEKSVLSLTERNRKNVLYSNGPRTLKGRSKVRHNALKHGLLASEAIV